jgi:endonuclease-3
MTTTNRAALLNKTHRVLKRTHKHSPLRGEQPLLESLLFACCLENTRHDAAQDAFAKLRNSFFDWNEIRVSTAKELAEVMQGLAEPMAAAARLKGILQSVFESDYSFDLEHLKKQNIGAAVKRLQKLSGATPFVVAYGTQVALSGHSIPVDKGTLGVLYVLGVISQSEADEGVVPGMERAIPKSKGHEFGCLLHEIGAEFFSNPFSPSLRELLLSIAPGAKERFPKRTSKKAPPEPVAAPAAQSDKAADGKKLHKELPHAKKAEAKSAQKHPAHAPKAAAGTKKKVAVVKKAAAKPLGKRKPR